MRSAKLEHTMGVARTKLLLYRFVGFVPNAIASLFHRSANTLQTPMDVVGAPPPTAAFAPPPTAAFAPRPCASTVRGNGAPVAL